MAAEAAEIPRVLADIVARRASFAELAGRIDLRTVPVAVLCGRGSSGHAAAHMRYLVETRLGIPVSETAPSVVTAYGADLKLDGALFVVISQSGKSPDLVAATKAARAAGARTVALVNEEDSPVAKAAEHVIALRAGREKSVAATKSVAASMFAAAEFVAALAGDSRLLDALARVPGRAASALQLEWGRAGEALAGAPCVYVTSRGYGLGPAREIALKCAETLRLPALAFSSAELLHGPRAAVTTRTPVLALRLGDPTAGGVDTLVRDLRAARVPVFLAGGPLTDLPWIGDDDPACDAISMLGPAYLMIERTARTMGFDPDRPPHLSKVTETL